MTVDVVVCGAGVGGLACARALGALGLSVVVLDRRTAPATVAKGELLQPEAVGILAGWGLLPSLLATAAVPVGRLTMRDPAGAPVLDLDYDVLPGPYRQILCTEYATVLRLLADGLGHTVQLRRGVLVDGPLRDRDTRVVGVRTVERGQHDELRARLVVAADGRSSGLRRASSVRTRQHAYGHRLLALDLPGAQVAAEVSAYLTDQGLRLVYPLPAVDGTPRCRLYVQVRPDELRGGMLTELDRWSDRLLAAMPGLAPLAQALHQGLPTRQVLAVHRLRAARLAGPGLALAGEAAHAVHPMAAQGMSSSLADAVALAASVAAAGGLDPGAVDTALRAYHRARRTRLDHIATVSHNAARMLTATDGLARRLGRRLLRNTATNPRLLRITTGNLAGIGVRPLTPVDRLYQLGLLTDPAARRPTREVAR